MKDNPKLETQSPENSFRILVQSVSRQAVFYGICDPVNALPSAPFPVEKVSEVDPDLPAVNVIVRIAAGIKADQFKTLMKI